MINFNFGTYSTTLLNSDGSVFAVDIEDWSWDNDQTVLVLGYDGEFDRFNIIELSETRLQFSGTYFEEYVDEAGQRQEIRLRNHYLCSSIKQMVLKLKKPCPLDRVFLYLGGNRTHSRRTGF